MNYTCFGCKTQYTSTSGTPTGIKWEDGHVCKPMKTRTLDELRQNKTYGYRPPVAKIAVAAITVPRPPNIALLPAASLLS